MKPDKKKTKSGSDKCGMDELVALASDARQQAYAPYSKFMVGAAIRSVTGEVFTGCNVENASYGLCMCAERTALFQAIAKGHRKFDAIAVVTGVYPPAPPCGQCLQALAEFADDMDVIIAGTDGTSSRIRLLELLPFRFRADMLG